MPLYLACIVPGIALVQETFGLDSNFGELSIPLFAASCPIQHVCHCHWWHVPDNLSCLRISQVLTLIDRIATLWVIGALSLCALYALGCSESIWIYHLDIHVQILQGTFRIWQSSIAGMWRVHCKSPICITRLWKVLNIVENVIFPTSSDLMHVCS